MIKDHILSKLQEEEKNHAHKITVKKLVPVKKKFIVKKEVPHTIKVVTKKLKAVKIKTPFTITTSTEEILPGIRPAKPEKCFCTAQLHASECGLCETYCLPVEDRKVVTSREDVEYRDVEHQVWEDVVEDREITQSIDTEEEREVMEEQTEEKDGPAYFSKPHDEIASTIHANLLKILSDEIKKPEYQGKTDQEIVDMINGSHVVSTTSKQVFPSATNRITANAKNEYNLHVKNKGNMADSMTWAIEQEIETDPEGRGYKGKTREEQMALIEKPFEKEIIENKVIGSKVSMLFHQIAYAPNVIEVVDIEMAKKI